MSIVYDSILNHISQYSNLSDQEKERFCAALTYKKIRRRQYLLQEGTICTRECFVIKGALRQYEVSPNGGENTLQFVFEQSTCFTPYIIGNRMGSLQRLK